jgi:hypothetical protein
MISGREVRRGTQQSTVIPGEAGDLVRLNGIEIIQPDEILSPSLRSGSG